MMNERIKELAEQAKDFAEQIPHFRGIEDGLTWEGKIQKVRDLKFAELIVRECAEVIDEKISPPSHPMNSIGYKLKEHFGVK